MLALGKRCLLWCAAFALLLLLGVNGGCDVPAGSLDGGASGASGQTAGKGAASAGAKAAGSGAAKTVGGKSASGDGTANRGGSPRMTALAQRCEALIPLQKSMPPVAPGDWRSFWKEPQQATRRYADSFPVTITAERKAMYLCRVGAFTPPQEETFGLIREYLSLCFQCEVKLMPDLELVAFPPTAQRAGKNRQPQINSVFLTDKLLKPKLPGDGWGVMAVTWFDIYTGEGLSEQYGDTLLFGRAGVISMYHLASSDPVQQLERALNGASHESSHLFSIPHCAQYLCNMNGRSGLAEFDRAPLHYCPDCLAKLLYATNADPLRRFADLQRFCAMHHIAEMDYFRRAASVWPAPSAPPAQP